MLSYTVKKDSGCEGNRSIAYGARVLKRKENEGIKKRRSIAERRFSYS